jgi:hypothetical protein
MVTAAEPSGSSHAPRNGSGTETDRAVGTPNSGFLSAFRALLAAEDGTPRATMLALPPGYTAIEIGDALYA